ncbi:MAG: hypothetical protein R6U62_08470 [Bacteroidales bacterium]
MRLFFYILSGILLLMFFKTTAVAQISGVSTPPFTFDTTPPVPLSGMAIGVTLLLVVGFLIRRHMRSGKKAGI